MARTCSISVSVVKLDYVEGGAGITLLRSMDYFVRATTLPYTSASRLFRLSYLHRRVQSLTFEFFFFSLFITLVQAFVQIPNLLVLRMLVSKLSQP